jgi:TetR/AcrR family transcriptional regulator, cholesterol catabolism regulator
MRGRKKSEETRSAILRCASEVFSERPYHEVLTEQLSARLGIGKGTLYRYFTSKEDLYFASIVRGLEGMHDAVAESIHADEPLETTIEAVTRTIIGYFWERRDFFVLFHRHEPKLDPGERAEWNRRREDHVNIIATVVARELERTGRNGVDPRLAVEMLFGMIRSVCLRRRPDDRIDDLAAVVTNVFLRGVLGGPEKRT